MNKADILICLYTVVIIKKIFAEVIYLCCITCCIIKNTFEKLYFCHLHCKKVQRFSRHSWDVKLSLAGNNLISDIPAWDGKITYLFL
jgi:hypothetical protein